MYVCTNGRRYYECYDKYMLEKVARCSETENVINSRERLFKIETITIRRASISKTKGKKRDFDLSPTELIVSSLSLSFVLSTTNQLVRLNRDRQIFAPSAVSLNGR